jgi:indole-3-glycerol phosphate synthase/phosphoribosylanthranilate isomerase
MIFAERSARKVAGASAEIAEAARSRGVQTVGVFQDQAPEFVAATTDRLGLDVVQLHGSEDVSAFRGIAKEIWAACAVGDEPEQERQGADRILYDTRANGRSGGTGKVFDWGKVSGRAQLPSAFLAGGIGPANARDAQRVGAYGMDVSSGVEVKPGRKDPVKVRALFGSLRVADRRAC